MTSELEGAVKRYRQWFGSYKKSGELIKVPVWLSVNNGYIEFLTLADSHKVKRTYDLGPNTALTASSLLMP